MNPSDTIPPPNDSRSQAARILPEGVDVSQQETSTTSSKNSRYISVPKLPSGFFFYPFDTLSIRRFNIVDLRKLYYSHVNNDMRALVEVINGTIDRDAFQLTAGDFWYLMYWQRINSYPKNPFRIEFRCNSESHKEMIKRENDSEKRSQLKQGLTSVLYMKDSNVKLIEIQDHDKLSEFATYAEHNSEYRTAFYPARMVDIISSIEMLEEFTKSERDEAQVISDPEIAALRIARKSSEFAGDDWWNNYASNIHPRHGETLLQRRSYMEQLAEQDVGPDFIDDIEHFLNLSRHGVVESIINKCEVCGEPIEAPISIDSLSFFPNL